MVTSTASGLAVPDWPLSYGMLFPPMVGGVFYEHGHRMIAAAVGFLTLILAFWLGFSREEKWLKILGFCALGAVILQGVLGGVTVLLMLPPAVSISHAVLSQTFFIITIVIAYGLSKGRNSRSFLNAEGFPKFEKSALILAVFVYLQLIAGALMRHTQSGLAIPDFPTMGGTFLPFFDQSMLSTINQWRFDMNLEPVTIGQVIIHFIHRIIAAIITALVIFLNYRAFKLRIGDLKILSTLFILDVLILLQLTLGIYTIWSVKQPLITSLHVMTGAAILGISALLTLQSAPVSIKGKNVLSLS